MSCSPATWGLPRSCSGFPTGLRPPLVYESHGYAPDVAAGAPCARRDGPAPRIAKTGTPAAARRSGVAEGRRLRHDYAGSRGPSERTVRRARRRHRRARRRASGRRCDGAPPVAGRGRAAAGGLRGAPVRLERRGHPDRSARRPPGSRRPHRRRSRARAGSGARPCPGRPAESRVPRHLYGAPRSAAGARGARAGQRAGPAEPRVGHLDAVYLAAEAVRIHGGRAPDRRLRSAGDTRGPDTRRRRRAGEARGSGWARRRYPACCLAIRRSPHAWPARRARVFARSRGIDAPSCSNGCSGAPSAASDDLGTPAGARALPGVPGPRSSGTASG